jgi:hypothetical protein
VEMLQEGIRKVVESSVTRLMKNETHRKIPSNQSYRSRNALLNRMVRDLRVSCDAPPRLYGGEDEEDE